MTPPTGFVRLRRPDLSPGPGKRSPIVRLICQPMLRGLAERLGFHLVPNHFYQPMPDFARLPGYLWEDTGDPVGIAFPLDRMRELLEAIDRVCAEELRSFPVEGPRPGAFHGFYLQNGYFESVDAEMLYGIVRTRRPRRIIEIGSGFSTRVMRSAIERNLADDPAGRCELVTVDPFASESLDADASAPWSVMRSPVQALDPESVRALEPGDMLFIDSSHVLCTGSDVAFEFLELIPRIGPGVLVHIHDIFIPGEYPREWVKSRRTAWNEQYILQALLTDSDAFRVFFAGQWVRVRHPGLLAEHIPSFRPESTSPGSFYFERV